MPKIIPLREIEPREILELERLAKNGTAFEARRARLILTLSNPLAANAALTEQLYENSELQNQLKEQNSHDSLTGLYNRRYLDSVMDIHMTRSKRGGNTLAFIMIDIDYFKDYNDCYGHQAGDECLKQVALSLQTSIQRASDLTARFGGEEFLMVLPNTTGTTALDFANEVQQSIAALNIPHERSTFGKVTISVGLAVMANNNYLEVADLLHAADDALYCAKNNGRNLVVFAGDTPQKLMTPEFRAGRNARHSGLTS